MRRAPGLWGHEPTCGRKRQVGVEGAVREVGVLQTRSVFALDVLCAVCARLAAVSGARLTEAAEDPLGELVAGEALRAWKELLSQWDLGAFLKAG